jgi:hypothetical protein
MPVIAKDNKPNPQNQRTANQLPLVFAHFNTHAYPDKPNKICEYKKTEQRENCQNPFNLVTGIRVIQVVTGRRPNL